MKTKFPIYESILLIIILILCLMSGCKIPQKTEPKPQVIDTVYTHKVDSFYLEQDGGYVEMETFVHDTVHNIVPCPPTTVINARRVRRSGNIDNSISLKNCFNENNNLKKSNQVFKSQVDSLTMITNKAKGQETNNGTKWWVFVLLGMGIGVTGYQAIRSAITKKI